MKNGYYKSKYNESWWVNNKLHREDGPAFIHVNGTQEWRINDQLHREDGPAIIWADGYQEWCVNDKVITDEVNTWFNLYNLTYETMDEEEKLIFGFHIRSLMK